jgi:hypothetical protein
MKNFIKTKINEYLNEKYFNDVYPKEKYVKLDFEKHPELLDNIFQLVNNAYSKKGGHFSLRNPQDLKSLDFWFASDINDNPYADVTIGGKKTPHGYKITTMGQDGSSEGKKEIIGKIKNLLASNGFYIEIAPDLINIFNDVNTITDQNTIEKILNKKVEMNNDGTYNRAIDGNLVTKLMVGHPKI